MGAVNIERTSQAPTSPYGVGTSSRTPLGPVAAIRLNAATYDGTTRGSAANVIHPRRNGRSARVVTHAVAIPIPTAVTVTATVRSKVLANSSTRRAGGIARAAPPPTTWIARLIGGISPGRRAIPAASHQPRLGRCLTGATPARGMASGAVT